MTDLEATDETNGIERTLLERRPPCDARA